jgi:predicted aspartyl protease
MEQVMKPNLIFTIFIVIVFATVGVHGDEAVEREADHGDFLFAGESVELALIESRMHPRVNVSIAEDEYEFIVDTGAGVNVIDTQLAEAQGYEVVGETEIGAPGGPQIPATGWQRHNQ